MRQRAQAAHVRLDAASMRHATAAQRRRRDDERTRRARLLRQAARALGAHAVLRAPRTLKAASHDDRPHFAARAHRPLVLPKTSAVKTASRSTRERPPHVPGDRGATLAPDEPHDLHCSTTAQLRGDANRVR
jgi:hypothetical protein